MEIVNGFVCQDCSDVALAKRMIDPAHPKDGPVSLRGAEAPDQTRQTPAVVLGGSLEAGGGLIPPVEKSQGADAPENRLGARLDILV